MECSEVKKILFEYDDPDFPRQARDEVEAHLEGCKSCAMHLKALRTQSEALRSLPKLHAPPHFLENIRMRVESPAPSALKRVRTVLADFFGAASFYKVAATAAAAVLVVVTAQMVLKDPRVKHEARVAAPLPAPALSPPAPSIPLAESVPRLAEAPSTSSTPPLATSPSVPDAPAPSAEAPSADSAAGGGRRLALSGPHQPRPAGKMMDNQAANKEVSDKALSSFAPADEEERPESVAIVLKIPRVSSPPGKTAGGLPAAKRAKRPSAADSPGAAQGGQIMEFSPAAVPDDASQSEILRRMMSEVMRLIRLASGKVLGEPPTGGTGPLLTEIPAENYPEFLDQLRKLGQTEFKSEKGKKFVPEPKSKVKVSVSFDARR